MYYLIVFVCLISLKVHSFENYSIDGFSKEIQVEFQEYFQANYLIGKEKNRLSLSANTKLRKLLSASVLESRKALKLNLNLIS